MEVGVAGSLLCFHTSVASGQRQPELAGQELTRAGWGSHGIGETFSTWNVYPFAQRPETTWR